MLADTGSASAAARSRASSRSSRARSRAAAGRCSSRRARASSARSAWARTPRSAISAQSEESLPLTWRRHSSAASAPASGWPRPQGKLRSELQRVGRQLGRRLGSGAAVPGRMWCSAASKSPRAMATVAVMWCAKVRVTPATLPVRRSPTSSSTRSHWPRSKAASRRSSRQKPSYSPGPPGAHRRLPRGRPPPPRRDGRPCAGRRTARSRSVPAPRDRQPAERRRVPSRRRARPPVRSPSAMSVVPSEFSAPASCTGAPTLLATAMACSA